MTQAIRWPDSTAQAHYLASKAGARQDNLKVHQAAWSDNESKRPLVAHAKQIQQEAHDARIALAHGFRDGATPEQLQVLAMDQLSAERQEEALRLFTGFGSASLVGPLNDRTAMIALDNLVNSERLFGSRWALAELSRFRDSGTEPQIAVDELASIARLARQEMIDDAA